jgi:hypothetical protein
MKITIKYDRGIKATEVITLEIQTEASNQLIEGDYQYRLKRAKDGEVIERRTAEEIFEELNRKEFNNWRQHNRYIDGSANFYEEDEEGALDELADYSQMEESQRKDDYEEQCQRIRELLKPAQADMIIAISLDGLSVGEYAKKIGEDDSNLVSKRFVYTKKVLKEILSKN